MELAYLIVEGLLEVKHVYAYESQLVLFRVIFGRIMSD